MFEYVHIHICVTLCATVQRVEASEQFVFSGFCSLLWSCGSLGITQAVRFGSWHLYALSYIMPAHQASFKVEERTRIQGNFECIASIALKAEEKIAKMAVFCAFLPSNTNFGLQNCRCIFFKPISLLQKWQGTDNSPYTWLHILNTIDNILFTRFIIIRPRPPGLLKCRVLLERAGLPSQGSLPKTPTEGRVVKTIRLLRPPSFLSFTGFILSSFIFEK